MVNLKTHSSFFKILQGESFELAETVNIGTKKSVAKQGIPIVLSKDKAIESNHARLTLVANKKIKKVLVRDLTKANSSGTFVNGKRIPTGKEQMSFANDKITFGNTTIEIQR